MATTTTNPNNPDGTWRIVGQVVERVSRRPVAGAAVEARDRDTRYHDLLGQTVSNEQGAFEIAFTADDFGDYGGDHLPDLFFRVSVDGQQVLDTMERAMVNVPPARIPVTLEIEGPPTLPEAKPDRVSVEQIVKFTDWWQASDFKGLWREGVGKASTFGGVLGEQASRRLGAWDFEPVRPSGTQEQQIVGQAPQQAQNALAAQQVTVTDVRPVTTGTRATLRTLGKTPLVLKPGDRVVLYEEDGKVKYYTREPEAAAASVDQQAVVGLQTEVSELKARAVQVETLRGEVAELRSSDAQHQQALAEEAQALRERAADVDKMRGELQQLRQSHAQKDAQIVQLSSDLVALRKAQDNLASRLPLARLEALEQQLGLMNRPRGRAAAGPEAAQKSAPASKAPPKEPRPPKGRLKTESKAKPEAKAKAEPTAAAPAPAASRQPRKSARRPPS